MRSTRASLLARIKDPRDTSAWSRFYDLYAPLLYRYARARGLSREDAEDVRSTCYEAIVRQIGTFEYESARGGFKAWLRTLVNRRVADLLRRRREKRAGSRELCRIAGVEATPDAIFERQWEHQHLRYCVSQVRGEVSKQAFAAFSMIVLDGCTVVQVCDELGMNPNQVYKAKARVLRLVRQKLSEIGDEDVRSPDEEA